MVQTHISDEVVHIECKPTPQLAMDRGTSGRSLALESLASNLDAQLEAALEASRQGATSTALGQEVDADDDDAALEAAIAMSLGRSAPRIRGYVDNPDEMQRALDESKACPLPRVPDFVDDQDELQRALEASNQEAEKEEKKRKERMRREDGTDLFQAALRASRVDLGPRGISQPAKIFASGDATIGQASVLAKTGSHMGSGGKFARDGETAVGGERKVSMSASSSRLPRTIGGSTAGLASVGARPKLIFFGNPPRHWCCHVKCCQHHKSGEGLQVRADVCGSLLVQSVSECSSVWTAGVRVGRLIAKVRQ
mmetsp:Transcript_32864/g.104378  ORF Transcript_32864/g.104378 Transcript_32864/m.104378 type:complete len:311 (-) Transcript_32864:17-949(-)